MSTVVAGVDFGTLSVRVSLVDSERGRNHSLHAGFSRRFFCFEPLKAVQLGFRFG